jgi:glycosyltransferase involved in cell wall biosynthesis
LGRENYRLSILLPVYNEEPNIPAVLEAIFKAVTPMDVPFEVIAVDDGSSDGTFRVLKECRHPALRIVRFRRNFGQTAALSAGFEHATGDIIITLDADGQNDPTDIPMLVERIFDGADIASGWRRDRKDTFLTRRLPSMIANGLISRVTGVKLHDYGCTLKAYRRHVVRETRLYGELHRFVPALASWGGARVDEVVVKHHPRLHGRSKYGIGRTLRVMLDLLTVKFLLSFGTRPIHLFGTFGAVSLFIGVLITGYLGFIRLVIVRPIAQRPLLLVGVLLILVGLQFISMGLIGELLVRIYHESSGKRTYTVAELIEPDGGSRPGKNAN